MNLETVSGSAVTSAALADLDALLGLADEAEQEVDEVEEMAEFEAVVPFDEEQFQVAIAALTAEVDVSLDLEVEELEEVVDDGEIDFSLEDEGEPVVEQVVEPVQVASADESDEGIDLDLDLDFVTESDESSEVESDNEDLSDEGIDLGLEAEDDEEVEEGVEDYDVSSIEEVELDEGDEDEPVTESELESVLSTAKISTKVVKAKRTAGEPFIRKVIVRESTPFEDAVATDTSEFWLLEKSDLLLSDMEKEIKMAEFEKSFNTVSVKVRENLCKLLLWLSGKKSPCAFFASSMQYIRQHEDTITKSDWNDWFLHRNRNGRMDYGAATASAQHNNYLNLFVKLKILVADDKGFYRHNPESVMLEKITNKSL